MLAAAAPRVDTLSDTRTGGAIMWFGGDAIMAVIMIVLVVGWLRRVDTAPADAKGWLEQARGATFTEHTGSGRRDAETLRRRRGGARRPTTSGWPTSTGAADRLLVEADEKVDSRSCREYARNAMCVSVCTTPGHLRQPAGDDLGDLVELARPGRSR